VKKEMHYVYLDLGDRTFCTLAIPRGNTVEEGGELRDEDHSPLRPLFEQTAPIGGAICCI